MRRNNQTNRLIMLLVIVGDFVLLNVVLYLFAKEFPKMEEWSWSNLRLYYIISNIALLASEWKFHTRIHDRFVSAGDILRGLFVMILTQTVIAYLLFRHLMYWTGTGWLVASIGVVYFMVLLVARLLERNMVKWFRKMGRNTRSVTLVGSDPELRNLCERLLKNPTLGYRFHGYYANEKVGDARIPWLGTVSGLMDNIAKGEEVDLGDELYVCLSRQEGDTIRRLSALCNSQVTQFFYVPISVESMGLDLHREYIDDIEVYSTHESPLDNPINRTVKWVLDILLSVVALAVTVLLIPLVWVMQKLQSPGPLLFKQERTGIDGKCFVCYKFRSMHVNKEADQLQATEDDPRKFPFGNFMRRTNIDEFPQFWNVIKGNMSVVGPRPHMLAHTKMYSKLIDKYMVRHFVKPGITGWAQVTGFRGETKELWQMEERVKRDIWYMEHWSIWLDIRIVWLTFKMLFKHDQNAY
ncbi:MAG: exopolysaccharide biosynthesis polyprenyl glycosylphosphotransferase [Prevotella sp.]|nr:exopolysaccharide biosynthesis polyprenyl glycosylphosphotransferase [Prevotella sp.]